VKKIKILVLVHKDLVPPVDIKPKEIDRDKAAWITEYDVISTYKKLGHEVRVEGVYSDLQVIRDSIEEFNPHIVFNLLEEFDGSVLKDQNVVSYLELLKVAYTGTNPRGLILGRDKALAKKVLTYHGIKTPKFFVFPKNKKTKLTEDLNYPLIVKCLFEEASYGIAKASVVHNKEKLEERILYINKNLQTDAIVEEFIEGREYYVGVVGNYRLKTLPVWELVYDKLDAPEKEIYSSRAKWNPEYRLRKGINHKKADISRELEKKIIDVCKEVFKVLNLNGYARIDLRIDKDENIYVLEANPNPNIALDDEFAKSAEFSGFSYEDLLEKIASLGIEWNKLDE
jgi:D-alanine-D-alanine ligase